MPHELEYTAIVLKRQPYAEADEIITLLTREAGKVRVLGKNTKSLTSKLSPQVLPMFLSRVTTTSSNGLAKLIRAQALATFPNLHNDPVRLRLFYIAAELSIKATPDSQKNQPLFDLLREYLEFLDQPKLSDQDLANTLSKFKIHFLETLGWGVSTAGGLTANSAVLQADTGEIFQQLKKISFAETPRVARSEQLEQLLASFISYHLEREIKSESFNFA